MLPLDSTDTSGEMGSIDSGGLTICPQDPRITISDGKRCDDMLCLLNFSSPENSMYLHVVGKPHHWRGIVRDPGIIGIPRLNLCCDCLCLCCDCLWVTTLLCVALPFVVLLDFLRRL